MPEDKLKLPVRCNVASVICGPAAAVAASDDE